MSIDEHVPAIRRLAVHMAKRSRSAAMDPDDAFQIAYLAFQEAMGRYDPTNERRASVRTFCMALARGAILDELRRLDWVPRAWRARGEPTPDLFSLDAFAEGQGDELDTQGSCEWRAHEREQSTIRAAERLEYVIAPLPFRERAIARWRYRDGARYREIAEQIGTTESRVAQIMADKIEPVLRERAAAYVAA